MKCVLLCLFSIQLLIAEEVEKYTFVLPGDSRLQEVSAKVSLEELQSKHLQEIIDQMFLIARGERSDMEKGVMVGLAAPQIGILKRIILVDTGVEMGKEELGQLEVFINPVLLKKSSTIVMEREGCYSVADCLCGIVPRSESVVVQALDRNGFSLTREFSGMTARIFQHEIDHLEGIRFPDRVGPDGVLHWVKEDEYPEYRKNWQQWKVLCSWSDWCAMKSGKKHN